jgi:hypothetical protein
MPKNPPNPRKLLFMDPPRPPNRETLALASFSVRPNPLTPATSRHLPPPAQGPPGPDPGPPGPDPGRTAVRRRLRHQADTRAARPRSSPPSLHAAPPETSPPAGVPAGDEHRRRPGPDSPPSATSMSRSSFPVSSGSGEPHPRRYPTGGPELPAARHPSRDLAGSAAPRRSSPRRREPCQAPAPPPPWTSASFPASSGRARPVTLTTARTPRLGRLLSGAQLQQRRPSQAGRPTAQLPRA